MNEPFDSSDSDAAMPDQPQDVEQQLRTFRPRAAQLNWDELTQASMTNSLVRVQTDSAMRAGEGYPGYSARQLVAAVAASWLLGAFVGGGSILWSMSTASDPSTSGTRADIVSNSPLDTIDKSSDDLRPSVDPEPKSQEANQEMVQTNGYQSTVAVKSRILGTASTLPMPEMTFSALSWQSDQPLTVRSFAVPRVAERLTATSPHSFQDPPDPIDPALSPTYERAATSDRKQLMQQYLKEVDGPIY